MQNTESRTVFRILAPVFGILVSSSSLATTIVIVDPGHGGKDDGAVRSGLTESRITLEVSQKLAELLRKDKRFKVHLTRDDNRFVSLPERTRFAKDRKADLFVSIHVNSSPDPKAHGAEFYFQNQLPPDEESMLLAHRENSADGSSEGLGTYPFLESNRYPADVSSIVGDLLDGDRILRSSQLSKFLKQNWRGSRKSKLGNVRQAPFFVLSQMTLPSSLVELGFLTHPDDFEALTSGAQQNRMAEDIYRGIVAYKESMDKTGSGQ